jgi:UDP-N-acetylglucosamine 2-epimerase (non-hydrolysing)/UDP-GlcNAc3NAcA epimerase
MKILSIVGARPQFIKAALVSKKLRKKGIKKVLVHTGQHYDFSMSDVFFKELNLPKPDYYLGIGSGSHGWQTGRMLIEIEKVLLKENPDIVLVYGDTNTTLAGALASAKLHIPVAHIEAGLRSFNKKMPEEINRILTDHISDLLFCPSKVAVENLKREGITKGVYLVGDVMLDIALEVSKTVDTDKVVNKYNLPYKGFVLTTIHRAENTDNKENLINIWKALKKLALKGIKIFFPVHPRTYKALQKYHLLEEPIPENLILNDPISYKEMVALEKSAKVIITDSGGVQKESVYFQTPCVIPRNETEWVELVELGYAFLVGANENLIVQKVEELFNKGLKVDVTKNPYGDGKTSDQIVEVLLAEKITL